MQTGIVGTGLVGSSAVYDMLMSGVGGELVLVDINEARAQAETDELRHATPFNILGKLLRGEWLHSRATVCCIGTFYPRSTENLLRIDTRGSQSS